MMNEWNFWVGEIADSAEWLCSPPTAWGPQFNPQNARKNITLNVVVCACNLSGGEAKTGGFPGVADQS